MSKAKTKDGLSLFDKIKSWISWTLYDLKIKIFYPKGERPKKRTGSLKAQERSHITFCLLMIAIPVIQFIIFYICVNFNSILLAFQKMDSFGNRSWMHPLTENFRILFYNMGHEAIYKYALKNSLIAYLVTTLLPMPFALLFSFFIYKKAWGGKIFKIMLFIPSVVSSIIMVTMYQFLVDNAYPALIESLFNKTGVIGLYTNPQLRFTTVMIYAIFTGFGPNVLMYLSAMNSINPSLVEACELDGANHFQEFVHLTFPMVYPTFVTFMVVGLTGIFTNQVNLVSFMGTKGALAQYQTFGYYMYSQTAADRANYPMMTCLGLLMTVVIAPLTILIKKVLEKIGPSAE